MKTLFIGIFFSFLILQSSWGCNAHLENHIQEAVSITNEIRCAHDCCVLQYDPVLTKVAQCHAEFMAERQHLSHNAGSKTLTCRMKDAKCKCKCYGENVACKTKSAAHTVSLWMDSPGHRKNILKAKYTHIGMGCATCKKGHLYWSQVFGKA